MTFYNRNGVLYVSINGKRISTKLKYSKENIKLYESYTKNEEFFKKFNVNKSVPTFLQLCEDVLKEKEKVLKPTSYNNYLCTFQKHIIPFFQNKKVDEIKPLDIKNWFNLFNSRSAVIIGQAVLKPAFENALLGEYIKTNPMISVKKPKYKKSDYEIKPFNHLELQTILDYDCPIIGNFLAIACFTGLRTGEMFGLRWKDIDFKNRTINVFQQITKGYIQSPKTVKSKSKIDLPSEAFPYFEKQRLKTGLREYVFYAPRGELFKSTATINLLLKKLLDVLGIEKRNIYQTRHTFASIRLSMGERLDWVSFMLRHESVDITLKKYYKYIKDLDTKRVDLNFTLAQNRHTS